MNLFRVDLKVRAAHEELHSVRFLVDEAEDLCKAVGNDSTKRWVLRTRHAQHCMRLAATSLPVGEDSTVVTIDDRLNEWESTLIIDVALQCVRPIHRVKGKVLRNAITIRLGQLNLIILLIDCKHVLTIHIDFLFVHGPYTNHDFNAFCVALSLLHFVIVGFFNFGCLVSRKL